MKWKKFKDIESLEAGDLLYIKDKSPLIKVAYLDHTCIRSIPEQWQAVPENISKKGIIKDSRGKKIGQIKKFLRLTHPHTK